MYRLLPNKTKQKNPTQLKSERMFVCKNELRSTRVCDCKGWAPTLFFWPQINEIKASSARLHQNLRLFSENLLENETEAAQTAEPQSCTFILTSTNQFVCSDCLLPAVKSFLASFYRLVWFLQVTACFFHFYRPFYFFSTQKKHLRNTRCF